MPEHGGRIYPRERWRPEAPNYLRLAEQAKPVEAFIHHSDDKEGLSYNTMREQCEKMREIQHFHIHGRGWADIAYHFVVFQKIGTHNQARAFAARSARFVPAAQQDHNTKTLAICVVGNGETEELFTNTRYVIERIIKRFPSVQVIGGHRDVVATTCPGRHFYAAVPLIAKALDLRRY